MRNLCEMGPGGTIDYTVSAVLKIRYYMLNRYDDLTLALHWPGITMCSNPASELRILPSDP
ncbi:MAG: hypothetical protein ABSG75_08455 [Syntrophales bacterium]